MSSNLKNHGSNPPPVIPFADEDRSLAQALRSAYLPEELSKERNDALLEQALGLVLNEPLPDDVFAPPADDVFAPPTPEELEQATLLSQALDGQCSHPLADLALALKHAQSPEALLPLRLERALKTVAATPSTRPLPRAAAQGRLLLWAKPAAGAGVALALAAVFALFWLPQQAPDGSAMERPSDPMMASRSLAPLFVEASSQGTATERMDRIVMARSRDLRHNRYLTWRVR